MDITLITIVIFVFVAIVFLLLFLFRSTNNKSFMAEDGSVFESKADLDIYESLYQKTLPLFSELDTKGSSQIILGFDKIFINKLTKEGFNDLKTLVKYRRQIESLSVLINN